MQGRRGLFWPLRLMVVLSLAVPLLLFTYANWHTYASIQAQTDQRNLAALDILQEHTLKALQTVEVSLAQANEMLRGLSDAEVREREAEFHDRLRRAQSINGHMEAIWAFDQEGHPLVSSTVFPVPQQLDNSDRSYFAAQKRSEGATFIGEVVKARIGNATFFVVSGRRWSAQPGNFNGIVAITLPPANFTDFYRKLGRGADSFALLRADGTFLARYPDQNRDRALTATAHSLLAALSHSPDEGLLTTTSPIDQRERRAAYRKVPAYPLYVTASVETAAVRQEFLDGLWIQLAVGLPATAALFGLSLYTLRRAHRFQEEVARRETAEAALKQSQRLEALGQLTGGVAHDFNNLLMVVSGNAELLGRIGVSDARSQARLRQAIDALGTVTKRGSALTRALLSFSRRQTHATRSLDPKRHLEALQSVLMSSIRGDKTLTVDAPEGLWPIEVDAGEFELALLNIVMNARDALPDGGSVTIALSNRHLHRPNECDLEGDFVAVAISDTGHGIPADILPRLFEPFFTTKDVGKGTGLGLSQVYGFARQAGGMATIRSEPARGTTVSLYLPRSRRAVDGGPPAVAAEPGPIRKTTRTVLLVEDNPDVAGTAILLLQELGYSVMHTTDAASARRALQSTGKRFDAVLSDILMPGGENGLELARWVRQEFGDRTPVVLATG